MVLLLIGGTLPGCRWIATFDEGSDAPITAAVLTHQGTDQYQLAAFGDRLDIRAPSSNTGSNLRAVFWPAGAPVLADSAACATWTSQSADLGQEGVAFRVRRQPGRLRAVTVTKNTAYGARWIFNFHTWDTDRATAFAPFGAVEIPALVTGSGLAPLPWRFCAQVRGNRVQFKVWPQNRSEPAWGDPAWGGSRTIPAGWDQPGTTGWYAGHLGPGGTARYDELRTWQWK